MSAQMDDATRLSDDNLQLRRDLAALRHALERANAERDGFRTKYMDAAFRLEQFKFAVAKLCKENAS
jgi:hypothetical protein